jgi:hypothetical protein
MVKERNACGKERSLHFGARSPNKQAAVTLPSKRKPLPVIDVPSVFTGIVLFLHNAS